MSNFAQVKRFAVALASLLKFATCASAGENCLFQISQPEAPYYVLGAPVTPQSSYLVVADCNKTIDEVRAELVAPSRERAEAEVREEARAQARADARKARLEAEASARTRERRGGVTPSQRQSSAPSWWSRLWKGRAFQE